jgi:hydroxypyruvate isomerase
MHAAIDEAKANGVPNIITFSGNRKGMGDAEGADNCVAWLNKVKAHAEDKGITICMEYLNSKVNHKDYMFDHIAWGVDVMKRVNSPRVKILYDIYHAQIMDGDIVRNIRDHFQWIGHFHTGGNPGRHEIDESQELNYRFVAQAIADLGYTGYVGHEYSPLKGETYLESLKTAMAIFGA